MVMVMVMVMVVPDGVVDEDDGWWKTKTKTSDDG